jgi:homocysteine S-methyltransferase
MMRRYSDVVGSGRTVLTDAATGTRLRFGTPWSPDPHIKAASFAVTAGQTRATRALFAGYATIAREFGLPFVVYAPTSRATPDRCRAAGLPAEGPGNVNERCVELLRGVRDRVTHPEMFIAGVVGPAHDAFDPSTALASDVARAFHEPQARVLAEAGIDLLIAAPFPAVSEALGVGQVLAQTRREYLLALVLDPDGNLLDGTPLNEAIRRLDEATDPPPVHYIIQCVHPRLANVALEQLAHDRSGALERIRGIKANAADASLAALDASTRIKGDDPETWARQLHRTGQDHGCVLLGGCCGTDERHLFSLALRLAEDEDVNHSRR